MERYKISLFIFAVIALLALTCSIFPEEGVKAGEMTLRFPSIDEIIGGREEEALAPEKVLEIRRKAPEAFALPEGRDDFFSPLFEALENAEAEPVRIVHYGDSQIEEDRITSTIRDCLQSRFGGGGVGLLPAHEYNTLREGVRCSAELDEKIAYGPATQRAGYNRYGPAAKFSRLDTTAVFSFVPFKGNTGPSRCFNRLTVYSGNGSLHASCRGASRSISGGVMTRTVFTLPDSTSKVSLTLSGHADIHGISLDNDKGVSVDNIAMRGCDGTLFTAINSSQLRSYFSETGTRLIILQYGGNAVPYTKTSKAVSAYCSGIRRQLDHIHSLAPEALILFIGPSDMSTTVAGKRQTYPVLPEYIDSLRTSVTTHGAAYWDLYEAMGGHDSMIQWVKSSLAGPDYIHFTPKGAEHVGTMFTEALMLYYDYYRSGRKK